MNWLRALAPFAVALAFIALFALVGPWAPALSPQLVQVRQVTPTDVEPGDRIAILGDGFPAGKEARVSFRGMLHRPGQTPVHGAEIVVTGTVAGPERVEVGFGEATQALFCGQGIHAVHTTFEGELEVAFAAATQGAAPVAGLLRHVVLDIRPSASLEDRAREPDGVEVLALLGIRIASPARRGVGLAVDAVAPQSRAEAAGIAAGDVLTSFDGVRIASVSDLVPAPGEREATVGVQTRASGPDIPRVLSVSGLRRAPPVEVLPAAILVVAALSIVILFGAPIQSLATTSAQRAVSRLRARAVAATLGSKGRRSAAGLARALFASAVREAVPPRPSAFLVVDAAVWALLIAVTFGQYLVAANLDVGLLYMVAVTAVAVAAVGSSRSFWGALHAVVHVAWQQVPAAIVVAGVVFATGSVRMPEIVGAQGGWPWEWLAFSSPVALLALGLLLACAEGARSVPSASSPLERLIDDPEHGTVKRESWVGAAYRAHTLVYAGLAVMLFLGGWHLPSVSPAQQDARTALQVVGAAWFVAKTGLVVLMLSWLRLALPAGRADEATRATAVWRAPLALSTVAAMLLWSRWSPQHAVELLVSGSLLTIVTIAALSGIKELHHGVVSTRADGHLSPFL